MQISNLVKVIVVTLLSADIGPLDRATCAAAVTYANRSTKLAAPIRLRGLREWPLSLTAKKIVVREAGSGQNNTSTNASDSPEPPEVDSAESAHVGDDYLHTDEGHGKPFYNSVWIIRRVWE